MSDGKNSEYYEIDVLDIIKTIWDGKYVVISFIVIAAFCGFLYTKFSPKSYMITVAYNVNLYPVYAFKACGGKHSCYKDFASEKVLQLLGGEWSHRKDSSSVSLNTLEPMSRDEYYDEFKKLENSVTQAFLLEAQNEVSLISDQFSGSLLGTEYVASNLLNASRLIAEVQKGNLAVEFKKPAISISSPRLKRVILASVILAALFGVAFVLLRKVVRERK